MAYAAFLHAASNNLRRANPELAFTVDPLGPYTVASAMNNRLNAKRKLSLTDREEYYVRKAIAKEPLNRVLIRTLAIIHDLKGNRQAAARSMELANRISRRDGVVQLWLAEYNKILVRPRNVLQHYSTALVVNPKVSLVVFPALADLLSSDVYRREARGYARGVAPWISDFLSFMADRSVVDTIKFINPVVDKLRGPENDKVFYKMVLHHARSGNKGEAISLASRAFDNFDEKRFFKFNWNQSTQDYRLGQLSWRLGSGSGINTSLGEKGGLSVIASPNSRGEFISRSTFVRPGQYYTLEHRIAGDELFESSSLKWEVSCQMYSIENVISSSAMKLDGGKSKFFARFRVPDQCAFIKLSAYFNDGESQFPSQFEISDLKLTMVR